MMVGSSLKHNISQLLMCCCYAAAEHAVHTVASDCDGGQGQHCIGENTGHDGESSPKQYIPQLLSCCCRSQCSHNRRETMKEDKVSFALGKMSANNRGVALCNTQHLLLLLCCCNAHCSHNGPQTMQRTESALYLARCETMMVGSYLQHNTTSLSCQCAAAMLLQCTPCSHSGP